VSVREVRHHLVSHGYTLAGSTCPDPLARAQRGLSSSECFDATNGETVRVCVWTWSRSGMPDDFSIDAFMRDNQVMAETHDRVLVAISPTGAACDRAMQSSWSD
jgi:hypothetical protein